jgi:sucrose-6-phosphate hydrolase SacC (GH32 family)
MALPRLLGIGADGHLRQTPAPAFESLRGPEIALRGVRLDQRVEPLGKKIGGDCLELEAAFEISTARAVGLHVRGVQIAYQPSDGMLSIGERRTFVGRDQRLSLRVFLDKCLLEVYANDGAGVMLTALDAGAKDLSTAAFARHGAAELSSLRAWPLRPARFNMEKFVA